MYKASEDLTYSVEIKQEDGKVRMLFTADCGKFGTDETLDEHVLTPEQLLNILQASEDEKPQEQCHITDVSICKEQFDTLLRAIRKYTRGGGIAPL